VALSIYVHIPYCLQRCRYCDFTTFERSEILPPEKYVSQLVSEIQNRNQRWREREVQTIYFGGGTPSLLEPRLIITILRELANVGFIWGRDAEITIEINPATMDGAKLEDYLQAGINRFSVGAQTFNDAALQSCGRKHTAEETRATLRLLKGHNYSFDLLFALPNQSLSEVQHDLDEVAKFMPPHLSAYCLTVPESHPMAKGRAPEDEQIAMFDAIESRLAAMGIYKYEISNFAQPGFESRHNLVYWSDTNFWGLGLSAHSYDRSSGNFGERFWNTKDLRAYGAQSQLSTLPAGQSETLMQNEAMTDFCHMFLRVRRGLSLEAVRNKFGVQLAALIESEILSLVQDGLLEVTDHRFVLTPRGELISNQIFERLTFLPAELPGPQA
jgi:oxygen-independent coproporphyrinogen-3 oxidase